MTRSSVLLRLALLGAVACVGLSSNDSAAQTLARESEPAQGAPQVRLRYAVAQPSRLVVLMVTRLRAELKIAGFVAVLPTNPDDAAAEADDVTKGPSYADVALSANGERLQLEIASRSLGASSHVVLVGTERDVPALALQATEFLRAGVIPRVAVDASAPTPTALGADETAPRSAALPEARGRWLVDVGGTLLTNWRAGDRLVLLSLGTGYAWASRVSLGASVDVPVTTATFEPESGAADYRLWLGHLQADYAWLRWRSGEASLGLGVGMAKTTTTGRPHAPLAPGHAELWSLSLGARLAAEVRLSPILALLGQARLVSLSPNPIVAVLDDERRLGGPSILLELGVRVGGR